MKYLFLISSVVIFFSGFGQTIDLFDDANFKNPLWHGDTSKFTFMDGQLRSNSTNSNDVFGISTSSKYALNCQWGIDIMLNFSTSSKNYINVVLISDSVNLDNSKNAYFLRIGDTKDNLAFWKKTNGVSTKIYNSPPGTISGGSSKSNIKIIRNLDSTFSLYADFNGTKNYTHLSTIKDKEITNSLYAGITINQSTSSFFTKHYFDNFYVGPIILDTTAPYVTQFSQIDLNTLHLTFNEIIDTTRVKNKANYNLNKGIGSPTEVQILNTRNILIKFNSLSNTQQYKLDIKNIADKANNISADTSIIFFSLVSYNANFLELVITELMVNPYPSVNLPQKEYIEIYNNSNKPIKLDNLYIKDLSETKPLPNNILLPSEYAILCAQGDSSIFAKYGKTISISTLPSLNNKEDVISIKDSSGRIIHTVNYKTAILPNEKQSGWSLEMKDINNPCNFENNWSASINSIGGTPGMPNSVSQINPDEKTPYLKYCFPINNRSLHISFNEDLNIYDNLDLNNFRIFEWNESPISMVLSDSLHSVRLTFPSNFINDKLYHLEVSNIADCVGNITQYDTASFGLPQAPKPYDIKINEVLYNPILNGSEFLEIFNFSNKFLDLSKIKIAKKKNNTLNFVHYISNKSLLFPPKSFLVLTKDISKVSSQHKTKDSTTFFETDALFTLNNEETEVVILNNINEEIERLKYNPSWHYEIVKDSKGVSLERIDMTIGNNAHNWTSAASNIGYATPGLPNSQSSSGFSVLDNFKLEYKSFSPNEDGNKDVLKIKYKGLNPNTVLNAKIFNDRGVFIQTISHNETLATEGMITWKGMTADNKKASIGIYIIFLEYFTSDGKVETKKLSCALTK